MTYRAAIIGCGRIGADINPPGMGSSRLECHAAAYSSSSRVHLAAACDVDAGRREEARRRWSIPRVYADAREMIERENLDIVSICTGPEQRQRLLDDLLSTGGTRALLAEKPLASTREEADRLVAATRRSSVVSAVNYVRRFVPVYQETASAIRSGSLGRLQLVRGIYSKGILNNGGHMIDLLRLCLGEPLEVEAGGRSIDHAEDPTLGFRLVFDGGVEAIVDAVDHQTCTIFELDVIGTRGRVLFSDLGHLLTRWTVEEASAAHGFRQLTPQSTQCDTGLSRGIAAAVDNLLDCLEGRAVPLCTFDDARAALALALEVRKRALAGAKTQVAM